MSITLVFGCIILVESAFGSGHTAGDALDSAVTGHVISWTIPSAPTIDDESESVLLEASEMDTSSVDTFDAFLKTLTDNVISVSLPSAKDMRPIIDPFIWSILNPKKGIIDYQAQELSVSVKCLAPMIASQTISDEDNDEFTPDLSEPVEGPVGRVVVENTPMGEMILGKPIHMGDFSTVFEIQNHPELIIKYQANCDSTVPFNPLLNDMWFGQPAAKAGISPMPYFISPATALPSTPTFKTRFNMEKRDICISSGQLGRNPASVRYLIMEKSGINLHRFITSRPNLKILDIVKIIKYAMHLVSQLHLIGMNHGDIHSGNIVINSSGADGGYKIFLIDYGRSFPIRKNRPNERILKRGFWRSNMETHWQIDGQRWGPRDDALRIVYIFAKYLNPFYTAFQTRLVEKFGWEYLYRFKSLFTIFKTSKDPEWKCEEALPDHGPNITWGPLIDGITTDHVRVSIQETLKMLLCEIRTINDVNDLPNYTRIFEILDRLESITTTYNV